MSKVNKIKVKDSLKNAILEAVNSVCVFENFIKRGETILLKPNFNTADPFPASTDIEFLKTVAEVFCEYGAEPVIIGDSSTLLLKTRKVMQDLGVFKLEKSNLPIKIIAFDEHEWVNHKIKNGKYLKKVSLPEILEQVDKIILLPCLKTHSIAKFTGALKLSVGFVKPSQRIKMHLGNLQGKVAELNTLINPDLVIMDARRCFITGGPGNGEVREPNLILASKDRVSMDIEGVKIIQSFRGNSLVGIDPLKLPQIKRAIELKIE